MELGKPIRLDFTRENYLNDPETLKRVDEYILNRNVNAVPIKSLALFVNPISLDEIRKEIPSFMPPQMYFVLDHQPKLKALLEKQPLKEKLFIHKHDEIYYANLARSVSELEKTDEFQKLNLQHEKNKDFINIKY